MKMVGETFQDWTRELAERRGISLEEVRSLAGIIRIRWRRLLRGSPPTREEAEAIASEAFGLFPAEAYTSEERDLATQFRGFLGAREAYRFPRLWPKVLGQIPFRDGDQEDPLETFEIVLEDDKSDESWRDLPPV
jgi:transcriptional regulator with XRE-family HTH domain